MSDFELLTNDNEDCINSDVNHIQNNKKHFEKMINCSASTSSMEIVNCKNNPEINKNKSVFDRLIEKCYENPNFPDSKIKVVDELYKSLPDEFVQSKYFVAMVKEANNKIWPDSSTSFYVHFDVIHEQLNQFKTSMEAQNIIVSDENIEERIKNLKKLKKLKVALKKVRKKIKNLHEAEMDVSDENTSFGINSAYILSDRYEKRALEIYKQMCKLSKEPNFLETPPLRFKGTKNKLVNKSIEKYYNLHKSFPDYYEIFTLLKVLNEKKKLNWTDTELNNISHDAFIKLGKQLKIQRLNEYFGRLTDATTDKDPAEENPELKKKLDKSNIKLQLDLVALRKEFITKQEQKEETEGSSLNNTDCEISEDESNTNNTPYKKANLIPIKRKRSLSNESDQNTLLKKSKKTMYMESFNLTPCVVLEKLHNVNKKTDYINHVLDGNNSKQDTDKILKKVKDNMSNSDENLENNLVKESSLMDSNNGSKLNTDDDNVCIDSKNTFETVNAIPQEDEVSTLQSDKNNLDSSTIIIDCEDNEPIVTEPEVIIHKDHTPNNDIIEINDSDEKIPDKNIFKVPVQNKQSLESIINSMHFDKKYNWGQKSVRAENQNLNSPLIYGSLFNHKLNNPNSYVQNNNQINRWITNNTQPSRSNIMYSRHPNQFGTNRFIINRPVVNPRMQSSFQRSSTQTARQVTHRFLNSVQQERNFTNNRSVLSQRVTTMTTTTVRQIVQQQSSVQLQRGRGSSANHSRRPFTFQNNQREKPELIELE